MCLSTEIDSRTTDGGRDERRDRRTKSERGEKEGGGVAGVRGEGEGGERAAKMVAGVLHGRH